MASKKLRTLNVGNLLVLVGLTWLGFTFWVPYGTANRVFRIESRAQQITKGFRDRLMQEQEIDWGDTALRERIVADVNGSLGFDDPNGSLRLRSATPPTTLAGKAFVYEGKHYYYLLTRTPRSLVGLMKIERPGGRDDPTSHKEQDLPLEVYGWPRSLDEGFRTAFYFPSDDRGAFTRNLNNRYRGLRRPPFPGNGRREVEAISPDDEYRGYDEERWIYLAAPQ